jgi:cell division initiation protein
MISPMEISERRFERAARGYRVEEVDAFLQDIASSVASMIHSLEENENTIKNLTTKISEFEDDEG